MNRLYNVLIILITLMVLVSCTRDKRKKELQDQLKLAQLYDYVEDSIGYKETAINSRAKYVRKYSLGDGNLINSYYSYGNKKQGPSYELENGKIQRKLTYFNGEQVFVDTYHWNGDKLDSVVSFVKSRTSGDTTFWEYTGRLIFTNSGSIETQESKWYSTNIISPIVFYGEENPVNFKFYNENQLITITFGDLDNTLLLCKDGISKSTYHSSYKLFLKDLYENNFGYISGIIRYCEEVHDTNVYTGCHRQPFYIPFFVANRNQTEHLELW